MGQKYDTKAAFWDIHNNTKPGLQITDIRLTLAEPGKYCTYSCLKIKFIQRLYYSGKFQMFYNKAAVWGRWPI